MANEATFETAILGVGNTTGIEVPQDVIDKLDAGRRPAVLVNVNGFEYRSTVAVMGGKYLVSVSAAIREQSGLAAGDEVTVHLTVASEPREVNVPGDFAQALEDAGARPFFDDLANSLQRMHIDNITGAKTDDTRTRRIQKSVDLFLAGKKR